MPSQSPTSLDRWLHVSAFLAAIGGASAWLVSELSAADLWWHLASGREVFRVGHVLGSDPFSFTTHKTWLNHEWLWQVLAWAKGFCRTWSDHSCEIESSASDLYTLLKDIDQHDRRWSDVIQERYSQRA